MKERPSCCAHKVICFHPSHSKYQLGDFVGAHDFFNLDLDGAAFRIGKRKLEAERREDILSFEEV
jgi:hypothetical protein